MSWVAWRQYRAAVAALAAMLGAIGLFVLVTGLRMRAFEGGLDCLGVNAAPSCGGQGDFNRAFGNLSGLGAWSNLLPGIAGVFLGAPLVARELERGTHRLVWTQGVTRVRWLSAEVAVALGASVATGALLAALMTWWRQPFDIIGSRLAPDAFDLEGVMPAVDAAFAFSLGAAAGAVIRRVVPAMVATFAVFLAVRLPVMAWVRPHLLPATTVTGSPAGIKAVEAPEGAWVLDSGLIDRSGHQVFNAEVTAACPPPAVSAGTPKVDGVDACLADHGFRVSVTYQPAEHFWPLQLIEGAIYLALIAGLLVLTVVWVRRRLV